MLGNMRFLSRTDKTTELLLIEICCLSVALIVVLLTLSRNTSRLNLNWKL